MPIYPRRYAGLRSPELAVEGAVLDGFGDMGDLDVVLFAEGGDGAGDFEQAVVGAGREMELLDRLLQFQLVHDQDRQLRDALERYIICQERLAAVHYGDSDLECIRSAKIVAGT
jgi:hypothetical protein